MRSSVSTTRHRPGRTPTSSMRSRQVTRRASSSNYRRARSRLAGHQRPNGFQRRRQPDRAVGLGRDVGFAGRPCRHPTGRHHHSSRGCIRWNRRNDERLLRRHAHTLGRRRAGCRSRRYSTQEVLTGQFNGDAAIDLVQLRRHLRGRVGRWRRLHRLRHRHRRQRHPLGVGPGGMGRLDGAPIDMGGCRRPRSSRAAMSTPSTTTGMSRVCSSCRAPHWSATRPMSYWISLLSPTARPKDARTTRMASSPASSRRYSDCGGTGAVVDHRCRLPARQQLRRAGCRTGSRPTPISSRSTPSCAAST